MKKLIFTIIFALLLSTVVYANKSTYNDDEQGRTRTISWYSDCGKIEYTNTTYIPHSLYKTYRNKTNRAYTPSNFDEYINELNNRMLCKSLAYDMEQAGINNGFTDYQIVTDIIRFVQSIPYSLDKDSTGYNEYPRYPAEIIYDNTGDCEDKAILLAGILREYGCDVVFVLLKGHIAVGINADLMGDYVEYNDEKYFLIEATSSGWNIGEFSNLYETATVVPIKNEYIY